MTVTLLSAVSLAVWGALWWRRVPGAAWVPYEPRRPVPWGLVDLALVVALFLAANAAGFALQTAAGGPASRGAVVLNERVVWAQAALSLAVMAASAVALAVRYRVTGRELGVVAARLGHDVRLGAVAFLALAPPTYLLQTLLVRGFESKHPLVELLRQQPRPSLIAATFTAAVLVAPLAEEYLFRGLLQGWLERYAAARGVGWNLIWGGPARPTEAQESQALQVARPDGDARSTDARRPAAGESEGAVAIDGRDAGRGCAADGAPLPASPGGPNAPAYWPTAASAFVFALLHINHGPDWIPLFFFALGLGYLYRQTHRLVPAIVVHLLLNGCSMLMLLLEILLAIPGS